LDHIFSAKKVAATVPVIVIVSRRPHSTRAARRENHLLPMSSVVAAFRNQVSRFLGPPYGSLPRPECVLDDRHGVLIEAHLKAQITQVMQLKAESIASSLKLEQKPRLASAP
jgi:hypothetical protein